MKAAVGVGARVGSLLGWSDGAADGLTVGYVPVQLEAVLCPLAHSAQVCVPPCSVTSAQKPYLAG